MKSLSLHSSGRFALAVSSRDSVLWDLDSFARCRTLNGGQEVGVQDVRDWLTRGPSNCLLITMKYHSPYMYTSIANLQSTLGTRLQ